MKLAKGKTVALLDELQPRCPSCKTKIYFNIVGDGDFTVECYGCGLAMRRLGILPLSHMKQVTIEGIMKYKVNVYQICRKIVVDVEAETDDEAKESATTLAKTFYYRGELIDDYVTCIQDNED